MEESMKRSMKIANVVVGVAVVVAAFLLLGVVVYSMPSANDLVAQEQARILASDGEKERAYRDEVARLNRR